MHTVLTAELRLCQQDCFCSPAPSKGKNPEPCHLQRVYASPHHLGEEKGAPCPGRGMMLWESQWCGGKTVDGYNLPPKNGREEEELESHFMYERCLSMWRSAMETTSSIKWIETTWKLQGLSPGKAQEWVCLETVPSQMKLETGKSQQKLPRASQAWLTCVSFCKNVTLSYKKSRKPVLFLFMKWQKQDFTSLLQHCVIYLVC